MRRKASTLALFWAWGGIFTSSTLAADLPNSSAAEKQDRAVDQAALQSLEIAQKKLQHLIVKYRKMAQEPELLAKLAEIDQQGTEIAFRLTQGSAVPSQRTRKNYQLWLASQIKTLDQWIESYPTYPRLDHAFFQRAKAYEELNSPDQARKDYLRVIHGYPQSQFRNQTWLALSEIATQNKNHEEAIKYLEAIESQPESIYFPIALYRLAWAHSNIGHLSIASSYLEKQILYYNSIQEHSKHLSPSDAAMREASLMDFVNFYYDGYEKSIPNFGLEKALKSFRVLEKKPFFGKMALRFAKLLRSHRKDTALFDWKNQLIQEETDLPETTHVITLVLDHQFNQNQLEAMIQTLGDLASIHDLQSKKKLNPENENDLRNSLAQIASGLQKQFQKGSQNPSKPKFIETLIQLYSVWIKITPADDLTLPSLYYNLAEAYFENRDYKRATQNHRWVLSHWHEDGKLQLETAELSWARSMYEDLNQSQLIPKELQPKPLETQEVQINLPAPAVEWIQELDRISLHTASTNEPFNRYLFEASRLLYSQGIRSKAIKRLIEFATSHSHSQYSPPAIALIMDTLVQSKNWPLTRDTARSLSKTQWAQSGLNQKLSELEMLASYQIIEEFSRQLEDQRVVSETQLYLKRYPSSPRVLQLKFLVAQSQLRMKNANLAMESLNSILKSPVQIDSEVTQIYQHSLIQRASLFEESLQFNEAIRDYETGLKRSPHDELIQKKLFILYWLSGTADFRCPGDSSAEIFEECQKYQSMALVYPRIADQTSKNLNEIKNQAFHGPQANRPIWSAVALGQPSKIPLHELLKLMKNLAKNWKNLEPAGQLTLLPALNSIIPRSLAVARTQLDREVPLKRVSPQTLARRSEWLREFESTVSTVLELPWTRIRAVAIYTLSLAYHDLIHSIEKAPVPSEMSLEEKNEYQKNLRIITQTFLKKAVELSSQAYGLSSKLSIEKRDWEMISSANKEILNSDTLTMQKTIPAQSMAMSPEPIHPKLLELVNPRFESDPLKNAWKKAIETSQWSLATYLLQEMKRRGLVDPIEEKIIQSITWCESGAQAEGLTLLEEILPNLKLESKIQMQKILLSYLISTRSIDRANRLWTEMNAQTTRTP